MLKRNCWEVKRCGREEGGKNVESHGVCPAATQECLDGLNNGKNGGRSCWVVEDTNCASCSGMYADPCATRISTCLKCEFFEIVAVEESESYISTMVLREVV